MKPLFCFVIALTALSCASGNKYSPRERVPVLVNNVGPFANPAETYEYYSLPFCAPRDVETKHEKLGEVLAGDRRTSSLYDLRYRVDTQWFALCHFTLTQDEIKLFRDAIEQNYVFELFVDGLSVRGFVGDVMDGVAQFDTHLHKTRHVYLFTHLHFSLAYNDDHVIAVNLTTDTNQKVRLEYGKIINVEFSYSVSWKPTTVSYFNRIMLHSARAIGDQSLNIHWLSIVNSSILVILLTSFLVVILIRILRKDVARITEDMEDPEAMQEEVGWKLLYGDVFRFPENKMLFSSMVGTGAQILLLTVMLLLLALVGTFYPGNRGAIYTAGLLLYALTAGVAGYTSTNLYVQIGGTKWATNGVLTACLFAVPAFGIFLLVNSVAIYYGSTSALPFATVFVLFILWALITFPLTIWGSMRAHRQGHKFDCPCKTKNAQREIPEVSWFRSPYVQVFMAGFLPFSAIYIELHYIFVSVWGHRVYTLFGVLFLTFVLLLIVTAFITVALTYFQLSAEDHRWWWRSFVSGGTTGFFVYCYACFFYFYRSKMYGLLQTCFFFGYMMLFSYAFFLMLGSLGFYCTLQFVKYIYSSVKLD